MNRNTRLPHAARRALPGLAQAGAAMALAAALLVLAASAPIHLAGIWDDWQVAASTKAVGSVVSPQVLATYVLCLRCLVVGVSLGAAVLLLWRRPGRPMALLVTLLIRTQRQKQQLLAFGLSEHYRQIFDLTQLSKAIGIYGSEADALAAAG